MRCSSRTRSIVYTLRFNNYILSWVRESETRTYDSGPRTCKRGRGWEEIQAPDHFSRARHRLDRAGPVGEACLVHTTFPCAALAGILFVRCTPSISVSSLAQACVRCGCMYGAVHEHLFGQRDRSSLPSTDCSDRSKALPSRPTVLESSMGRCHLVTHTNHL